MGRNTAIAGGLLRGFGDSMVQDAAAKRETVLQRLKLEAESAEKDKTREHDSAMLSKTVTDESGNIYGVNKGGKASPLNIRTAPPKGGKGSGKGYLSPEDKRLWDATVQRNTTKGLSGEAVDWDAVAETLRDQGREDMAEMAGPANANTNKVKVDSQEYREAKRQAEAWVDEQSTAMGVDEDEFKEYGGNREEARQAKTLEIYRELTGQGGSKKPPVVDKAEEEEPAATPAKSGQKVAGAPAGSGTKQDPYKGTTQAEIDWFKKNAPADSVIIANGKTYSK